MYIKPFILLLFISCSLKAATRLENEYKLHIPQNKIQEVWDYLSKDFPFLLKTGFKSEQSVEYFTDIYFDTSDFRLLRQQNSLRRRIRNIPGNPASVKDGRSLIQFKIGETGLNLINRNEVKLEVKEKMKSAHLGTNPLLLLINNDKIAYAQTLSRLRLQNKDLRVTLVIVQKRRRLYISYNGKPFATLSLDEVHSDKLWVKEKFTELEIELNENLYTDSTLSERAAMQIESDEIKKTVETIFPYVRVDLTPKYNKMFNLLTKDRSWYKRLITIENWFN